MKIEIKVISKEIISPISPTPNDLSNYKLSLLDQMIPPSFMPITLFYKATGNNLTNSEISSRLKKSLSKTLSLYYPLAGRLVDNNYVDCNDEGIMFVEALADCKLLDVINEPIPHEVDKLLPRNLDDVIDYCVLIQANFFNCGGMAIGFELSHKLGDAWSLSMFVNSWAAISRGDIEAHIPSPMFDGATLFPPRDSVFNPGNMMVTKENIITKRFVFTAAKINDLRDKYTNASRATRIEALTTFIWTRLMVSTRKEYDAKKIFTLIQVVNFRKRVVPPLSDDLFGNFFRPATAVPSLGFDGGEDEEGTNHRVLEKMREAIRTIGGDNYLTKIREGNQHYSNSMNDKVKKFLSGELVPFCFTSLCRFPLYEADFGWGKPVWIGSGNGLFKNLVTFLDSFSESGIEAWVALTLEDMAKFEVDEELLAYAPRYEK